MSTAASRLVAAVNWSAAALIVTVIAWCVRTSRLAAEDAVRTYGHNVDSGAYIILFAILYLLPLVVLLILAGAGFWRRWRSRWYLECAVVLWVAAAFYGAVEKL